MSAVVERAPARPPVRGPRYTALVAVQHPAAREAAVRILRNLGATDVLGATSVAQARHSANGRPGELCVLEAGLTDGSGVTLAKELDQLGWKRIVVLSTTEDPFAVRAALGSGVRCYLTTGNRATNQAPLNSAASLGGMSQREVEVLQLVADGHSNRDVGEQLGLSALTVKSHLARIARKLGTGDRAEMVMLALRAGVIR
ncbi:MAG: DNA-binding response regulator [Micrococcales bacterium]|nr:MAG: DNA-binding response regulator [Micrococcales bacterium]PIE26962.1 MAG: DNA-binding response regulator [Micrococcales bacterium]